MTAVAEELAKPLPGALLRGSPLLRLGYVALDGTPRVVPTSFLWRDGTVLIWTVTDSPKVRALRRNPAVALTVDHDGFPPRALLLRGTATVTVVPGVTEGYLQACLKTESSRSAEDFAADVRALYDDMAEIAITPEWARLNDFETTIPKPVEDLMRRKAGAGA